MNEAREGEQSGLAQYALSNTTPAFASSSMFGVFTILWPCAGRNAGDS